MDHYLQMFVRLALVAFFAATSVGAIAAPASPDCSSSGGNVACTRQGAVRGVEEAATIAFKGIPYARPPVGALRWRRPEPPASWQGVRDGTRFGPICPQMVGTTVQGDEDCLTLNVWRPAKLTQEKLPVMVWLHGGGNYQLSGQGTSSFDSVAYNGHALVPHGVVFVSYNLRLGALGFLTHPALDAESADHISGNYGSQDQVAMLHWVHDNIASFGGDPQRVFLFGTSAGGGNICALMTSPLTHGLIRGVAMESSVPSGCELTTHAQAEAGTGQRVTHLLGCDIARDVAACLRGKTPQEIVSVLPGKFTVMSRDFGPNVDGHVFPEQPIKAIVEHGAPVRSAIIGNTARETWQWADSAGVVTDAISYAAAIDRVFGAEVRERIIAAYPLSAYPTPRTAFAQLTTDALFTCQSVRVAHALARSGATVYRYLFDHVTENDAEMRAVGPVHTAEHQFFFNWEGRYTPTASDLAVQRQLLGYWTRMATDLNPNGDDALTWPATREGRDDYLEIGETLAIKNGPSSARCSFWDTIALPSPHM
ncbi:MAG TPA: carboxylesterase family protein [Candidatus Acidoferrum sp.]|nr:carboxylesterase family protein [Candidatus Acidoferrum sp.]